MQEITCAGTSDPSGNTDSTGKRQAVRQQCREKGGARPGRAAELANIKGPILYILLGTQITLFVAGGQAA